MDQRFLTLKEGEPAMATPFSITLPAATAIPLGAVVFIDIGESPAFSLATRFQFDTMLFIAANAASLGEPVTAIRQGRFIPYLVPDTYVGISPRRLYLDDLGQCTSTPPTELAVLPVGWLFATDNPAPPYIEAYADFGVPVVLANGWE